MKIGLVSPYIYPVPGGVAQHVRFLYENLRLRGHDVRIISTSHGPQRASEGDIIRLGFGFSVPTNGSVGTLTFSPRYLGQVRRMLDREQFDLLHFHEPFVPFLSLFLLRESQSVNVATFHAYAGFSPSYELGSRVMRGHAARLHGRIAVSAAARHFIDRFFPGDYKVIPNGVDVPRFAARRPDRPLAGRHAQHPVRRAVTSRARACSTCSRPTGSCARPATGTRLLMVGSGPQEREARRYVATRGLQGVEFLGRVSDAEKAQLFRTADVFVSPATGGESFGIVLLEAMAAGTPIVAADIHGYKGVVRRGREGLLVPPREPKALAEGDRAAPRRPGPARADGRGRPSGPRSSAGRGSPPRSRSTTASSSAGSPPPASLPAGLPRRDPSGAATAPGQAVGVRPPVARESGEWLRVRQRQPPGPRGVGDHEAGHGDGARQERRRRREQRRVAMPRSTVLTGNWNA